MVLKPNLPLPKGYFGDARLSAEQHHKFRAIIRQRLVTALRDEHAFVHVNQRQVDAAKWRLVKKKHQLCIFRRRHLPSSVTADEDTWKPSMMSVGRMEGTLEDVIYGSYDKSYEEMKTTLAYADVTTKDCAVLQTLELATPSDPFHYLGLKWLFTQLPASLIIKPRDWCYIEAMGITTDTSGSSGRFGYIILHSVDLQCCPPFDRRAVVRGKTQLSFIFREPVPGIVEIFSQGLFDPAGELIQRFVTIMTSEVLSGVFMMAKCAEAKKLTLLALRNFRDTAKMNSSSSSASSSQQLLKSCFVCKGSGGMFSKLKMCRVCGVTICPQCRVKKKIFVGPARSVRKVSCCRMCLVQAQSMEIRPAEPQFSILGEMVLPKDDFPIMESSEEPTPRQQQLDSSMTSDEGTANYNQSGDDYDNDDDADNLSELDVTSYRFSNESGMSEDDVEKLIAAMMSQRADSGGNTGDGDHRATDDEPEPSSSRELQAEGARVTQDLLAHEAPEPNGSESDGANGNDSTGGREAEEEQALYEKILRLQSAADEVYSITQANNEMMLKSLM